eukprot:5049212-Ditylum_brightwellii.AAC.1
MGIKETLDEHKVNYSKHTIIQAYGIKHQLEELILPEDKVTLIYLDINNRHPSIQIKLIRKALDHYTSKLTISARKVFQECMEMLTFGMKSMLICFRDRHYKYKRAASKNNVGNEDIGLAIG